MSFSNITADPAWGNLTTSDTVSFRGDSPGVPGLPFYDNGKTRYADLSATLTLAAVDTSGIVKPFAGWITYTGGGGGAPTRPTSGFLYPRGQG